MKTKKLPLAKTTFLTIAILFGISFISTASTFTAAFSGNWSNSGSWNGSNPGFNISNPNNIVIPTGITLTLDSDLVVMGDISLSGGTLDMNGKSLTINGAIITTGLGSIIGNKSSDVAFNGFSGAGNIVFAPGFQMVRNLTINIGSGDGVFLGSALTITGTLSLINGSIGIGNDNLTISGKGSVQGGSSSSFVLNIGTGGIMMTVPNSGSAYIFNVGTQNGYAPVSVTNNSATAGIFKVYAQEGVFSGGCTGTTISDVQNVVNTSWNVSSSLTSDINVKLEMSWATNMEVNGFNNTQAYASQYTSTGWTTSGLSSATLNSNGSFSMQMSTVDSFGQFAVFGNNSATSVKDIRAETSLSIYPNPAANFLNLSMANNSVYPMLKIFDVTGNVVIAQQIEKDFTLLDITNLGNGVYFASLDGLVTKKFIKE